MYLIFNTEQEALVVAYQEGQQRNFPYWNENDIGKTRTLNSPLQTTNSKWSLDVSNYISLNEEQISKTVNSVSFPSYNESV